MYNLFGMHLLKDIFFLANTHPQSVPGFEDPNRNARSEQPNVVINCTNYYSCTIRVGICEYKECELCRGERLGNLIVYYYYFLICIFCSIGILEPTVES